MVRCNLATVHYLDQLSLDEVVHNVYQLLMDLLIMDTKVLWGDSSTFKNKKLVEMSTLKFKFKHEHLLKVDVGCQ